jgi:hypothetical protein
MSDIGTGILASNRLRFWEIIAAFGFMCGMGAIAAYAFSGPHPGRVFSVLALVALASWLGGSLLGFLFGIPRFQAADRPEDDQSRVVPNTNLEQISDWLTKIIIGATLVQLNEIAAGVGRLAAAIGKELGSTAAGSASGAVILFFFFVGFMWGYLWCSLRIFTEMADLISARVQALRR